MGKHEPTEMRGGSPFEWRSPSRKTRTRYVDFRCPECGVTTRRNANRSLGGVICDGVKQTAQRVGLPAIDATVSVCGLGRCRVVEVNEATRQITVQRIEGNTDARYDVPMTLVDV